MSIKSLQRISPPQGNLSFFRRADPLSFVFRRLLLCIVCGWQLQQLGGIE